MWGKKKSYSKLDREDRNLFLCGICLQKQPITYLIKNSGNCASCENNIIPQQPTELQLAQQNPITVITKYNHQKVAIKYETLDYLYGLALGTLAQKDYSQRMDLMHELVKVITEVKAILNK